MRTDLQELLSDRDEMPVYDESIFDPEKVVKDFGFTDEDINDICAFVRWHIEQREKQARGNSPDLRAARKILLHVLRERQTSLAKQREAALLAELNALEKIR